MAKVRPKESDILPRGLGPALTAIRKHFGERPIFAPSGRRYIPTRHRALGLLLGGASHPGIPTGTVIETVGQAGSGKTSLTMALADAVINQPEDAEHQVWMPDSGKVETVPAPRRVLVLDFEQTFDIDYMRRAVRNTSLAEVDSKGRVVNAKTANVFVHTPDTLEEGIEIGIQLIASGELGLIVLDSVAAMLSEDERAARMGQNTMGLTARAMGKMFRKTVHLLRRYGTVMAIINQWRDKIGVSFGDPRTTPGGKAAEFFDSIRLDVTGPHKTPWFNPGKVVRVKAMKNKVTGRKGDQCEYHLGGGLGLCAELELVEALERARLATRRKGIVIKTGKNRIKHFGTVEECVAWLRDSPDETHRVLWANAARRGQEPQLIQQASGWEIDQ